MDPPSTRTHESPESTVFTEGPTTEVTTIYHEVDCQKTPYTTIQNGRWKEAEELEVQVMDTRKRVLGPEHPDTLTSMKNLALTYWTQRRWKEAEELEVQVMETSKRVLVPEHPDTLSSRHVHWVG
ncbi:hypothetical protein N7495_001978 [Penicillium taxi]|uniref:uncharacterized protein n=1 Tax=Penicillium taxi TaxID=168475 RepID=UPI0025456F5E|nr:uncharacterized protein N7495_001978 [Penicillium taxi]KAJ5901450.1 hypothetical protein N7495_001978 [Penicillium taxi]